MSSHAVLTAVSHRYEGEVVRALEHIAGVTVVRRCPDLADLLAAAASGLGRVALISADLRGLDRTAVERLRGDGVAVVGMCPPGDEPGEIRLRQLGLLAVVPTDASGPTLLEAVDRAVGAHLPDALPGLPRSGAEEVAGGTDDGLGRSAGSGGEGGGDPGGDVDGDVDAAGVGEAHLGEVIAVWGPTGAPGRSTLAVNLAAELAALGRTSLLVDADTYGASVAQALALLDEAPGLAAAARASDHGALDLPTLARLAPEVMPRLRVLTGLPRAERWTELRGPAVRDVLDLSRRLAHHVVIDCGFGLEDDEELSYDTLAPRRNAATLTALECADRVLAVGAGDPIGLQRLVRGLQELATLPTPAPLVVVNRVRASAVGARPTERIAEALQRFAGIGDARFVPNDAAATDAALLAGRTLAEVAPSSPARLAVRDLAAELAAVDAPAVRKRSRLRAGRLSR